MTSRLVLEATSGYKSRRIASGRQGGDRMTTAKARSARPRLEPLEDRLLLSAIAGVLFDDRNGDGVRQPGEPGLAGRVVFLDANRDGVLEHGERRTTTAADGSYRFA